MIAADLVNIICYCWDAIIILTLQKLLQPNCFGSATTCLANCDFSLELPVNFTFARISGFLPRLPQTIARSIAEIAEIASIGCRECRECSQVWWEVASCKSSIWVFLNVLLQSVLQQHHCWGSFLRRCTILYTFVAFLSSSPSSWPRSPTWWCWGPRRLICFCHNHLDQHDHHLNHHLDQHLDQHDDHDDDGGEEPERLPGLHRPQLLSTFTFRSRDGRCRDHLC